MCFARQQLEAVFARQQHRLARKEEGAACLY
jgi:hypothetical protein